MQATGRRLFSLVALKSNEPTPDLVTDRNSIQSGVLTGLVLLLGAVVTAPAATQPRNWQPFLESHCLDCHDQDVAKGNLNLAHLPLSLDQPGNFALWKRVFERVRNDEMPPKKKPRPPAPEQREFLAALEQQLLTADRADKLAKGRVNVRRLTRREYEHTIHDLLGVDLQLLDRLPEDPATHGFETVAEGQQLSHHHLRDYLETADHVLLHAFARALRGDRDFERRLDARQMSRRGGGNYRGPQMLGDVCHFWPITLQFYGRMPMSQVRESGWYRVTLRDVRAVNPTHQSVWGTLRSGACASSSPMLYPVGLIEATREKRDLSYTAWIRAGHMLEFKPNDASVRRARTGASGGNVGYRDGRSLAKERCEGIEVRAIEIERIYPHGDAKVVREKLFPGVTGADIQSLKEHPRQREIYEKVIGNFASQAFRRPTTPEQIAPYVDLALATLEQAGQEPQHALQAAYRAILCSPRFLTFIEPPGQLDLHALASRLSFALWNSLPDRQLRQAADSGSLEDPKEFHAQIDRLLDDPKSGRFIESFTDQWLNLKEIDFTTPDRRLYRTFDEVVKFSMLAETRAFLADLIQRDAPVSRLVKADHAMLNERLARFYGFKNLALVPGSGLQKVSLDEHPRNGLLTQGSVLKVTANGTTTSPVVRGVWVSERILGMEIPPPPADVPAVEPDIRGAVSIRDQLDKHRNNESCAACHRNIDPAGFALETFDPVGLYRSRYGSRGNAARVDPSGITPDGQPFADFREWRDIYAQRPRQLARAFVKHLLTYATGAAPRFCEQDELDRIVDQTRADDFGMRSLLHAALDSEIFRSK